MDEIGPAVDTGVHHLRVLIANEHQDRLALLADVVKGLGHEVVARETSVAAVVLRRRECAPTWRSSVSVRAPTIRST
jgi:hypothetical protein